MDLTLGVGGISHAQATEAGCPPASPEGEADGGHVAGRPVITESYVPLLEAPLIPRSKAPARPFESLPVCLSFQANGPGQRQIYVVMPGYVIHVPPLGE